MSHGKANRDIMNAGPDSERFLSREQCDRLARRVLEMTTGGGATSILIHSNWEGSVRWARNRVTLSSNSRRISVMISRIPQHGSRGTTTTNQIDDVSLEATVRAAERISSLHVDRTRDLTNDLPPGRKKASPRIWSDTTDQVPDDIRSEIARALVDESETKEMLAAGYIEMRSGQIGSLQRDRFGNELFNYDAFTNAQCTMTVRHPKGTGSGWAGLVNYDWGRIDGYALASTALDKCVRSLNPVAVEPGRYTVVLEPQALFDLTHDLVKNIVFGFGGRDSAEKGTGAFFQEYDRTLSMARSKLGLRMFDDRITISHDPMHPELGIVPLLYTVDGSQPDHYLSTTWVDRGVLSSLGYGRIYATKMLYEEDSALARPSFHMSGGETSISEMISSTKRGLLVTRFSGTRVLDGRSWLMSGLTRDGLWLIENGKISHAVKNMRFLDSPLFVLNQVEQLGPPVPVYAGGYSNDPTPAIVPPVKARDFSFISLVDAV